MALAPNRQSQGLAYVALALILYSTAFSLPTKFDSEYFAVISSAGYFLLAKVVLVSCVTLCLFVLTDKWRAMARALLSAKLWLLLLAWAFLSTLWSIEPKTTLLAAALFGIIYVLVAFIALRFEEDALARAIAVYLVALSVLSMAMGLLIPQYGLMNTAKFAGLLRGVYSHKNLLGDAVSLMLLWTLCAVFARQFRGPLALAAIVLGTITVAWTWSTTSILMLIICVGLLFTLRTAGALRLGATTLTVAIVILTVIALIIVPLVIEQVVNAFGKDLTFTGRDVIWQAYLRLAAERPLTGFGLGGITKSQDYGISIRFPNGSRPSPHNSLILLYVDLGIPAVVAFVMANVALILAGVRRIGRGDLGGLYGAVFPVGYAVNSLMEGVDGFGLSIGLVGLLYFAMRPSVFRTARIVRPSAAPATLAVVPPGRRAT